MNSSKLLRGVAAACVASVMASGASALTIGFAGDNRFNAPIEELGSVDTRLNTGSEILTGNFFAGEFELTGDEDPLTDFLAWCIELTQPLIEGGTYEVGDSGFSETILGNLDRLFTTFYDTLSSQVEEAAFQNAIWEIIYDGGLDPAAGAYRGTTYGPGVTTTVTTTTGFTGRTGRLSGGGSGTTTQQVTTYPSFQGLTDAYLLGIQGDEAESGGYTFTFLLSEDSQDLLVATAVPLPATALMLIAGLGGFAAIRRFGRA